MTTIGMHYVGHAVSIAPPQGWRNRVARQRAQNCRRAILVTRFFLCLARDAYLLSCPLNNPGRTASSR